MRSFPGIDGYPEIEMEDTFQNIENFRITLWLTRL